MPFLIAKFIAEQVVSVNSLVKPCKEDVKDRWEDIKIKPFVVSEPQQKGRLFFYMRLACLVTGNNNLHLFWNVQLFQG